MNDDLVFCIAIAPVILTLWMFGVLMFIHLVKRIIEVIKGEVQDD